MGRLSDKEIALAKYPNLAYASVSNYSLWVEERDKRVAQAAWKAGMREVVEWSIAERLILRLIKAKQAEKKPDDIQGQMVARAKMKALQRVIDNFSPLCGNPK